MGARECVCFWCTHVMRGIARHFGLVLQTNLGLAALPCPWLPVVHDDLAMLYDTTLLGAHVQCDTGQSEAERKSLP